jgi:hypothetical protein
VQAAKHSHKLWFPCLAISIVGDDFGNCLFQFKRHKRCFDVNVTYAVPIVKYVASISWE